MGLVVAMSVVAVLSDRIAPGDPFNTSSARVLLHPSRRYLMGTDQLGRDIFTGVVRGAHTSLRIVAGVLVISAVIGILLGTVAGLRGGLLDDALMRLTETVQSVPRFFLAILVTGWFGVGSGTLTVLLGLTSWPLLARTVRSETLSLARREFVDAARSLGATDLRVLLRHVIPSVMPSAVVVLALTASRVVLLEASLAFLGLADANVPSWGALVNNARAYLDVAWWMPVFPGLALALTVIGFNLVGDAIGDALDNQA